MSMMMRKINMLSRAQAVYRNERLPNEELGGWYHPYVLAVCANPGFSQEQLARHICTDKSNVCRHLSCLEKHGYIERRPDEEDHRVLRVYPTAKMEALLLGEQQVATEWNAYLAADLTEEELDTLHRLLNKVAERAQAYVDGKERPK